MLGFLKSACNYGQRSRINLWRQRKNNKLFCCGFPGTDASVMIRGNIVWVAWILPTWTYGRLFMLEMFFFFFRKQEEVWEGFYWSDDFKFSVFELELIISYLILCTLPFGLLNCFPPIKRGDIQFLQLLSTIHRHLTFCSSAQLGKIRFDIYFTKKKYLFYLNVLDLQGVFYWCPPKS